MLRNSKIALSQPDKCQPLPLAAGARVGAAWSTRHITLFSMYMAGHTLCTLSVNVNT